MIYTVGCFLFYFRNSLLQGSHDSKAFELDENSFESIQNIAGGCNHENMQCDLVKRGRHSTV